LVSLILPLSLALVAATSIPIEVQSSPLSVQSEPERAPNILLIIADDLGVEMLSSYGKGIDLPVTPNLDALAERSVQFRNAWSAPLCSPTRACIQTGRYGFRTGIGLTVKNHPVNNGLSAGEILLPEMLDVGTTHLYEHALFGKWHLNHSSAIDLSGAPIGSDVVRLQGYNYFKGTIHNILLTQSYYNWPKVENGVDSPSTKYATTAVVDDFLEWKNGINAPYFAVLAFHAPHSPYEAPPLGSYSQNLPAVPAPQPLLNPRPYYLAMVESLDFELGRLFSSLGQELESTTIIFMGDNGTPGPIIAGDPNQLFDFEHSKGRAYEGGVNVPLLIAGPAVSQPGSESQALVGAVDIFATVAELAGVDLKDPSVYPPGRPLDSISLMPYVAEPSLRSLRKVNYTERFFENTTIAAQPDKSQYSRFDICQQDIGFASGDSASYLSICGSPPVHNTDNVSTVVLEGAPANSKAFLLIGDFAPFANPLYDDLVTVSNVLLPTFFTEMGLILLKNPMTTDGSGMLILPGFNHLKSSPQDLYMQFAVQDPFTSAWSLSNAIVYDQSDNVKAVRTPDGFKLVSYVSGGPQELYYLPDDIDEQNNLLAGGVGALTDDEWIAFKTLRQAMKRKLSSDSVPAVRVGP
jgi:arylsulfatase B